MSQPALLYPASRWRRAVCWSVVAQGAKWRGRYPSDRLLRSNRRRTDALNPGASLILDEPRPERAFKRWTRMAGRLTQRFH